MKRHIHLRLVTNRTINSQKKKKKRNGFLALILLFSMLFSLTSCNVYIASDPSGTPIANDIYSPTTSPGTAPDLEGTLTVSFLDVGHGLSVFIQLPNQEYMLIDAGEEENADYVIAYALEQGVSDKIDYVIGSHGHSDHIGALARVIERFDEETIYLSPQQHTTTTYKNLLAAIRDKNCNKLIAKAGMDIIKDGNLHIQIVSPQNNEYSNINDSSVVIRLTYKDVSMLFTGDAQAAAENEMLMSGYELSADVLGVGHHGSDTSTTKAFVDIIKPSYAIISCDSTPDQVTLNTLKNTNIYRTDKSGTIILTTNGDKGNIDISTKKRSETKIEAHASDYIEEQIPEAKKEPASSDQFSNQRKNYNFIASVNTDVYHYSDCSYVNKIDENNKIGFESASDAEASGKRLCKKCIKRHKNGGN